MICPRCFFQMVKTVYHYGDREEVVYICPRCGYRERHVYPHLRPEKPWKPDSWKPGVRPLRDKWRA